MGFLDRLFNNDKKILDSIEKAVLPIDALKDEMASLSDEQLAHKTVELTAETEDYFVSVLPFVSIDCIVTGSFFLSSLNIESLH